MHNFWWFLAGFISFPVLAVVLIAAAVAIDDWRYERRWKAESQKARRPESQTERNYATHRWVGKRQCIPGEPDEYMRICDACGLEDRGDPLEFEDLKYPPCGGYSYVAGTTCQLSGSTLGPQQGIAGMYMPDTRGTLPTSTPPWGPIALPLPGAWRARHFANVARLDRAAVLSAVEFLRDWMEDSLELIRNLGRDNDEWWTEHHFCGMMGVRNALCQNGHGEEELGVDNLDDYAVGLVELAAGLTELCGSDNGDGVHCELLAGHPGNHYRRDATRSCAWNDPTRENTGEAAA